MLEEKLFKYLKEYDNFNRFDEKYSQNNPSSNLGYDICFRDWTEENYDKEEYVKWHKWLLGIIGMEGHKLLLEQVKRY